MRDEAGAPTEDAAAPTPEPLPTGGAQHRRRLAYSTAVFAGATGLSRVVGLVRESVVRYYFGTVGPINAFEVAFLVPNTVRALVADAALSSAFVPVFSELLEKGERKRAWRVASSLFWLIMLGLGGLTALFIVIAPWVMDIFGYSGVAVLVSKSLVNASPACSHPVFDFEQRIACASSASPPGEITLASVYVPKGGKGDED